MSGASGDSGRRGPLERLLLLHLQLAELATGAGLDEGASDAELCENILYYKNNASLDAGEPSSACLGSSQQEALQFAGLCTALYSIPSAIDPQKGDLNGTKEVYLENCSLVFELVEPPHVLAVAQIRRRAPSQHGGTPSAVGAAIQRVHRLFKLFRGGGVNVCAREALAQIRSLYELRKQVRKLELQIERNHDATTEHDLATRREQLAKLLLHIPLSRLRQDLHVHYDAFLTEFEARAAEHWGAGRSLVERVPAPIASLRKEQSSFLKLEPFFFVRMNLVIREFLEEQSAHNPRLLAVSSFTKGQFVSTLCGDDSLAISNETASLIMWYFASFRIKMQHGCRPPTANASKAKRGFRPFSLAFGADVDEHRLSDASRSTASGYLAPPPLSLLSSTDDAFAIMGHGDERIWAPSVSLPTGDHCLSCRSCLFDSGDLSMVLYLSSSTEDGKEGYETVLESFEKEFLSLEGSMPSADAQPSHSRAIAAWQEPGQDIVVVDRRDCSVSLLLNQARKDTSEKSKMRFLQSKHSSSELSTASANHEGVEMGESGDLRHLLADHLSLDCLLAMDDAMDEIGRVSHGETKQFCTALAGRWIYAYSDGGKRELYVLLDSKLYVTVADVQSTAEKIRLHFLG